MVSEEFVAATARRPNGPRGTRQQILPEQNVRETPPDPPARRSGEVSARQVDHVGRKPHRHGVERNLRERNLLAVDAVIPVLANQRRRAVRMHGQFLHLKLLRSHARLDLADRDGVEPVRPARVTNFAPSEYVAVDSCAVPVNCCRACSFTATPARSGPSCGARPLAACASTIPARVRPVLSTPNRTGHP